MNSTENKIQEYLEKHQDKAVKWNKEATAIIVNNLHKLPPTFILYLHF